MKQLTTLFALTLILCIASVAATAQTTPPATAPTTTQAAPATPTIAPSPSLAKDSRCFELRTYYAAPGKLEELHARFRNHTMKLFRKHGIEVVGFWGPTDKEKGSENTLVYLLVFPSREARDKAWKEFGADPDWQAARKESEKNGRLTEKVDSVIMMATDYAPAK
ncbi:MAG TPA: NIPSNAP family protein [Blastocatellia bacterium]|nr:NIPSNAP family protein [Blastocatellia bacterium]